MGNFFEQLKSQTEAARQEMLQAEVFKACQQGHIDCNAYRAFLTQAYHHVKHTVPLLMACGGRLDASHEPLRAALGHYIEEETGHHEWILDDIRHLGFDAEAVRENRGEGKVDWPIELMVAYLYHQIDRGNPMALLGMVWVLEGTSVSVGGAMADLIRHQLNLPEEAVTYLRSHSILDEDHIQFFENVVNQIEDPLDQAAIVASARQVFHLYGEMLRRLPVISHRAVA